MIFYGNKMIIAAIIQLHKAGVLTSTSYQMQTLENDENAKEYSNEFSPQTRTNKIQLHQVIGARRVVFVDVFYLNI